MTRSVGASPRPSMPPLPGLGEIGVARSRGFTRLAPGFTPGYRNAAPPGLRFGSADRWDGRRADGLLGGERSAGYSWPLLGGGGKPGSCDGSDGTPDLLGSPGSRLEGSENFSRRAAHDSDSSCPDGRRQRSGPAGGVTWQENIQASCGDGARGLGGLHGPVGGDHGISLVSYPRSIRGDAGLMPVCRDAPASPDRGYPRIIHGAGRHLCRPPRRRPDVEVQERFSWRTGASLRNGLPGPQGRRDNLPCDCARFFQPGVELSTST
jgi:hypothetical protein